MNEWEELRLELIRFVKRKFFSRPSISDIAEDIVDEAFTEVLADSEKCNFGYLSKVCIHIAYRFFKRSDSDGTKLTPLNASLDFIDDNDVVDEIIKSENTSEILASLQVLKQIERIIILQRYYGDFSFAEIAKQNSIKLNTVLSHHRRALEKLRPRLSAFAYSREKTKCNNEKHEPNNPTKLY